MDAVVAYDRDAVRAWLLSRDAVQDRYAESVADDLEITAGSNPHDGDLLNTLDDLLAREPAGWVARTDVDGIGIWPNGDGALVTLDLRGFPRVASMHQDAKWFSRRCGIEAALDGLAHVAETVNRLGTAIDEARR